MPEPALSGARPRPRLAVVAGVLVAMATAGVSLIVGTEGSSGAPVAGAAAATAPSAASAVAMTDGAAPSTVTPDNQPSSSTDQSSALPDQSSAPDSQASSAGAGPPSAGAPTPPSTGAPVAAAPAARAAAPVAARAASAAKPPVPARPRPPATTAPTAPPPADSAAQLQQVQAIADTSGWDWRKVHVQFKIGFDPEACCHWGVYDPQDHKTIWIGPTAFGDATRIRYVVLHELAHAWQWHSHRLKKLSADMAPWGYSDLDALEAGADCIATDWGAAASSGHYWLCPPDAQALMAKRLAGQWK